MINIGIDPVIFHIGFFTLRWYSLMIILGIIVALWWGLRAAKSAGFSRDTIYTIAIWVVPGGIIGSRLIHIFDQLDYYIINPGSLIGGAGEAIWGAILGGAAAGWIGSKVSKFPFWRMVDLAAPGLLLAQAIGRVGCIINGCCYGKPTSLPWGLVYTHPDTYAPLGVATQPVVGYELLWDLAIFALILLLRGKLKPEGTLFLLYLALYSTGRFFDDFLRESKLYLGGLHQAQIIALLVLVISAIVLTYRMYRYRRQEQVAPAPDSIHK